MRVVNQWPLTVGKCVLQPISQSITQTGQCEWLNWDDNDSRNMMLILDHTLFSVVRLSDV